MTESLHLDEYQTRLLKLHQLKEAGVIPYANNFPKTDLIAQLNEKANNYNLPDGELLMNEGAENTYSTAGRMIAFRTHGKLSFAKISDSSGEIQLAFVRDHCKLFTGKELVEEITIADEQLSAYKFVEKYLDVADFIGVKGDLFITKHGEVTVFVNEFQLLSKALRPLGDKRHGVKDEEKLYRQRYLDMTMNEETYQRFLFKSKFYETVRTFYRQQGFVEIETSILGNAASGAAARPFTTHHHDYDLDVYLRIAFEISLKMATVGRFEKVFEIGRDFRNEGSDPSHIQEFTQVEHYAVYRNYEDNMCFTEKMFDFLFAELHLAKQLPIKSKDGTTKLVDRTTPRQKIDYIEGIKQASGGIDITRYGMDDAEKLRTAILAQGIQREDMGKQGTTTLIDYLYKKVLRPSILGPAFVYNYPKLMQPLARQSDNHPNIVEQFQVVVNGREIIKSYSELVDPTIQQANFNQQAEAAAKGDYEATSGDDDFLLAMEHGMPPQSGFGMGLERILTLLTGQDNIRDVVMFPLMKPGQEAEREKQKDAEETEKEREGEENREKEKTTEERKKIYVGQESDISSFPTETQAIQLVEQYLTDTKRHCLQVGSVMRRFAHKLGQDEQYRWLAGVLHDIDRDHIAKDPTKHLKDDFEKIMDQIDAPAQLRDDIRSHGERLTGVPVDSLLRKYLASVDELSGFLYAYSLMRPTGFVGMEPKGALKRIKDKAFAAGVDREHLRNCEKYLGIPLAEFIPQMREAMESMSWE